MDIQTKLEILSRSAKYDASCASSGSNRQNTPGGTGSGHASGICHSWSADGRCVSLLKILLTNKCIYNCIYCISRSSNDTERASFTPHEICSLTMNFYKRNYIEGLFLSSAVYLSPDYTMELLIKTVKLLRESYHFNGYIHLKGIPGADLSLIREAGLYVDRMSINIELPTSRSLKLLAPQKQKDAILKPMGFINTKIAESVENHNKYRSPKFLPAGQSTQLIIGASPETDLTILMLSEGLYRNFALKRVYYSAYIPISDNPNLPVISSPPLLREHRLYQADWLLRFYGFSAGELLDENNQNLDISLDPKSNWAMNNLHIFPVEINTADFSLLVRIPGIGIRSAQKIVAARRAATLDYYDLKKLGVVLKRSRHFITCKGKYCGEYFNGSFIKPHLLSGSYKKDYKSLEGLEQLSIFQFLTDKHTAVMGEL